MAKFSSREEYERWKAQRLQHGRNAGSSTTERTEEQRTSPNATYPAEGGKAVAGGMSRWIITLLVLVIVGAIAAFGLRGKSKAPQTDITPGPQPTAPGSSYMESVREAREAHEERIVDVKDQVERALSNTPTDDSATLILDNQTDMEVYVKVVSDRNVGNKRVNVPPHSKVDVEHCRTGGHFLKMRYRTANGYVFQKGEPFGMSSRSTTTITLHKIVGGNYRSTPMSPAEF